jgi:hypothetical protein
MLITLLFHVNRLGVGYLLFPFFFFFFFSLSDYMYKAYVYSSLPIVTRHFFFSMILYVQSLCLFIMTYSHPTFLLSMILYVQSLCLFIIPIITLHFFFQ